MRWLAILPVFGLLLVPAADAQNYEIGPGDVVHVVVLGQDGMTGDFPIDAEGMMYFPFLGRVKASGMAAPELERKLTTLLADGYLRQPQVAVSIKEFRSRRVFVTGEVQRPGAHGLRANGSLMTLLADVGGVTTEAGHEVIVVRPPQEVPEGPGGDEPAAEAADGTLPPEAGEGTDPEETAEAGEAEGEDSESGEEPEELLVSRLPGEVAGSEVFRISLRELLSGNPAKDLPLEEGDTVYVPKAAQVFVTGHVVRPGAFRYEEGITVYEALTLAGGPSGRGSSKVRIVRLVDGKREEIKAKMTDVLLPGDTVKVPERFF